MMARRLASATAAAVLALAGATAVSTPAHAQPPGCSMGAGHYQQAGGYITAYRWWFCTNGNDIPLSVSIERYLSPGVYETVASGSGDVTYHCAGWDYRVYRAAGKPDFAILCT